MWLGRGVLIIGDEKSDEGERIFGLPPNDLLAGHYICELHSVKLGVVVRKGIIKVK